MSGLLTRRPDLSHEEFHRYWTEVHTPMRATPAPGAPYDGVAEIWFDSLTDAATMLRSATTAQSFDEPPGERAPGRA